MAVPTSKNVQDNRSQSKDEQKESIQQPPKDNLVEPEKLLFTWIASERPFKRRDRKFWMTLIAIGAIFGLILFVAEGVMPVILIISLIFFFYILSTVEPRNIEYSITNKGIKIVDRRTDWHILKRFWFTKRYDSDLLVFEMSVLPGRMELVINSKDKLKIETALKDFILKEEAPPSNLDKMSNWLAQKLPQS